MIYYVKKKKKKKKNLVWQRQHLMNTAHSKVSRYKRPYFKNPDITIFYV